MNRQEFASSIQTEMHPQHTDAFVGGTASGNPRPPGGVYGIEDHRLGGNRMTWLKSNWHWAALNLFAVSALAFVLSWGSTDMRDTRALDPILESGKWAIRFLLICLATTPLNAYFGWSSAVKLRKPAGLWAYGFAIVHVLFYSSEAKLAWLAPPIQPFIVLGLIGLLILTALAITSNRWAMRRLGQNWKPLHRLVYFAGGAVASHAMLATAASKRIYLRDPQSIHELKVYLALLVVLLVVRIPVVRRALKQLPALLRLRRRAALPPLP